ncbi:hypothetical protein PSACC_02737 [Paramicrosporidium saccamoebae]|uniref:Uncharacterized protein n=1 Tax=Paramicrosporidium saccamoebae TaxID=1246581 RepID=A0A2H9TI68_9FUNG|nr:hypothetical protein PSACC_02737 [Paramicrosporidium saccamoebae]
MLERNLQGCLLYISTMAMEYRSHMPTPHEPIRSSPFRILVGHTASESWGGILKKLLSETASANILG